MPFTTNAILESPKDYLEIAIAQANSAGLCDVGDRVVGVHDVDDCAVLKVVVVD